MTAGGGGYSDIGGGVDMPGVGTSRSAILAEVISKVFCRRLEGVIGDIVEGNWAGIGGPYQGYSAADGARANDQDGALVEGGGRRGPPGGGGGREVAQWGLVAGEEGGEGVGCFEAAVAGNLGRVVRGWQDCKAGVKVGG